MRTGLILSVLLLVGCDTTPQAQRWEYTSVPGNFTTANMRDVLAARSGTDWELVAVPVQQNNDAVFIFKRPATTNAP